MNKKDKFFEELEALGKQHNIDFNIAFSDDVRDFLNRLKELQLITPDKLGEISGGPAAASTLTDNGAKIIKYLQENNKIHTAKSIAEGMGAKSRSVAGAMRKLIQEGYIEKLGGEPNSYKLTELGNELKID